MSYFATVSGADLSSATVPGLSFVPAQRAQRYVRELASQIGALDGQPVFFCDDGRTGTSSDFVGGAEDLAASSSTLEGHPILQLLELCQSANAVLRVWWAQDDPNDFQRVVPCNPAQAVALMLEQKHPAGWHVRIAP